MYMQWEIARGRHFWISMYFPHVTIAVPTMTSFRLQHSTNTTKHVSVMHYNASDANVYFLSPHHLNDVAKTAVSARLGAKP